MQRSLVLIAVGIHIRTLVDQGFCGLVIACVRAVVERRPAVRVNRIDVTVALLDDGQERLWLFLDYGGEDGLVDWSLIKNTFPIVNLVAAIHKVLDVFFICLTGSLIQVLNHISGKFIFAHIEWPFRLSKDGARGLSSLILEHIGNLENAEVAGHMKWRLSILVLLVEHFFQEHLGLVFEFLADEVELVWAHQLPKLT